MLILDGTVNPDSIEINGTSEDISITTTDGNTFNDATTGNVTFLWVDDEVKGHLQLTIAGIALHFSLRTIVTLRPLD